MTSRDWDKELAKIDKQLASISDEALAAPAPVVPTGMPRGAGATSVRSAPPAVAARRRDRQGTLVGTYTKVRSRRRVPWVSGSGRGRRVAVCRSWGSWARPAPSRCWDCGARAGRGGIASGSRTC
jgi:hypothetical protein